MLKGETQTIILMRAKECVDRRIIEDAYVE